MKTKLLGIFLALLAPVCAFGQGSGQFGGSAGVGGGTVAAQTPNGIPVSGSTSSSISGVVCTPPTVNGIYDVLYNVTASTAVAPSCPQLGLVPDQAAGANLLYSDNGGKVLNPAAALGVPATLLTSTPNFYTVIDNEQSGSTTLTPVTPWNLKLNRNAAGTSQAAVTIQNDQICNVQVDSLTANQIDVNCIPTAYLPTNDVLVGVANNATETALADTSAGGLAETYNGTTHAFGTIAITGSGTVNNCTTVGAIALYPASGTTIGCGNGDFTYATHTLTMGSSGILDLHASVGGLIIPTGNCTTITTQASIAVNTASTNGMCFRSDAAHAWQLAVAAVAGTANTTCVNQVITVLSTVASPTCTSPGVLGVANVTPVTSSNPTINTDQALIQLSLPAGFLNVALDTVKIEEGGIYSSTAASSPALTYKVKLCTVSGCGSGTVVTLFNIVTSTLNTTALTNATMNLVGTCITSTTGASGNLICHGAPGLTIDTGATLSAPDTLFADTNTAVSSNIDLTAALFLQFTVAQSVVGASNSYTQQYGSIR